MEGRENPWRQGSILAPETITALRLANEEGEADDIEHIFIVISHDCDIADDEASEPFVELIHGVSIDEIGGDYSHGKNVRKLHLPFSDGEVQNFKAEFIAGERLRLKKADLFAHNPAPKARLNRDEFRTLQLWLAARYARSSFEDDFVRKFKSGNEKKKFYNKFARIIKNCRCIWAVLFNVDDENLAADDDTYSLEIWLIFDQSGDPSLAETAAKKAASDIDQLAARFFFLESQWHDIEFRPCVVLPETGVSIADERKLREWYFDYLSIGDDAD